MPADWCAAGRAAASGWQQGGPPPAQPPPGGRRRVAAAGGGGSAGWAAAGRPPARGVAGGAAAGGGPAGEEARGGEQEGAAARAARRAEARGGAASRATTSRSRSARSRIVGRIPVRDRTFIDMTRRSSWAARRTRSSACTTSRGSGRERGSRWAGASGSRSSIGQAEDILGVGCCRRPTGTRTTTRRRRCPIVPQLVFETRPASRASGSEADPIVYVSTSDRGDAVELAFQPPRRSSSATASAAGSASRGSGSRPPTRATCTSRRSSRSSSWSARRTFLRFGLTLPLDGPSSARRSRRRGDPRGDRDPARLSDRGEGAAGPGLAWRGLRRRRARPVGRSEGALGSAVGAVAPDRLALAGARGGAGHAPGADPR